MSFGQQLRVRRECSSGIGRPYSAETLRTYSRTSSPLINNSGSRTSSRLPVRPHSSCDIIRAPSQPAIPNDELLAQIKAGCDPLPNVNSSIPSKSENHVAARFRTVKRRYLCNFATAFNSTNNTNEPVAVPTMSHFEIKLQTDETKLDHIRMYYCDFLAPASVESPIDCDECTVEVEKLCDWLLNVSPRTRFDAFPLWVLTKDMLRRFLSKEIHLVSKEAKQQAEHLQGLQDTIQKMGEELKQKDADVKAQQQQVADLSTLSDEIKLWKFKAESLERESIDLRVEIERLTRALEEEKTQGAKKLESKSLEIKSKVELSWINQVDSMKTQAEKALAEAENERDARNRLQQKFDELQAELGAACQRIEAQASQETKLVQMLQDSSKLDIDKFRAILPVIHPKDLAQLLQDLLFDKRLPPYFAETAKSSDDPSKDAKDEEIQNVLKGMSQSDSQKEGIQLSRLPKDAQWSLFQTIVSTYSTDLNPNDSEDKDAPTILPSLLELMIRPPNPSVLQGLLSHFCGIETSADADQNKDQIVREAEHTDIVMKQIENLTTQYEKASMENAELLNQIAALRTELEEAQRKLAPTDVQLNIGGTQACKDGSMPLQEPEQPTALDPIFFKPSVLRVYIVDDRILKGKQAKPLPVAALLGLIANAFEAKARADSIDDRKGNKRQNFPEFMRDFFLNKYGVKSLSYFNFKSFIMGIEQSLSLSPEKFAENLKKQSKAIVSDPVDLQRRLRIFGIVSGIYYHPDWNEQLADFVLCALGRLFTVENIKESLEPKDQKGILCIDTMSGLEAAKEAWVQCTRQADLYPAVEKRLLLSAGVASNLALYEWLDVLINEWLTLSGDINAKLVALFREHDTDGNGSMDLSEFRSLVKSGSGIEDEKDISHLFGEALTETAANASNNQDPDAMRPEAFVYVARKYGLLPSLTKTSSVALRRSSAL